ncbi:MAG: gliding motility-associated C-terminal domain-containing protein [Bacteroidetes bacterium]|nr:gliding motility-associated C-terminal domain-containing protein [Bacteroidota bacterium]
MMKKIYFFCASITTLLAGAQTPFWTENFGTGCNQLQLANGLNASGNGAWTVSILGAEDPQANTWYISAEENGNATGACGSGCGSNRTLHVGSIANSSGFSPCSTGDCGASYDAGGTSSIGGTSTGTNKRAESPTINCTGHNSITLGFRFIGNGDALSDNASLWYYDGTTWTQINPSLKSSLCGGGQGLWKSFSTALPASANNNPNVKIGFLWINNDDGVGTDPSIAVDSVTLSDASTLPVVTIVPSATTICLTTTLTLNGSATNSPTSYSWTANPSAGVTFIPNATTPTVNATFTSTGTYTFTLSATNASGTGTSTQTVTVLSAVTPSVNITANPSGTVCPGTVVTFSAMATNGGTSPSYQWNLNGSNAGTNSPTYTLIPTNGNQVYVTLTSNAACASPSVAVSNTITINVGNVVPSVSITASPTGTVCPGTVVTFSAMATNGGTSPSYQWNLNGSNAGTNSPTYTLIPTNGNQVYVTLTSNAACASPSVAVSNTITVNVGAVVPSVSITASPTGTVCPGTVVTFSAMASNGGTAPSYQWSLNGSNAGTNSPTYTLIPTNGNQVYVTLTSNAACASPSVAVSNTITINVGNVVPSVSITASPSGTVCPGTVVTFSAMATNGGTSPSYQWNLNGSNAGTNSPTYTLIPTNGNQVYVTLTSNAACASPSVAVSNTITVNVGSGTLTTAGTQTICSSGTAVLSAGGTNWLWAPASSLSCNTCASPHASPSVTTTYTVTSVIGTCTLSATEMVVVNPGPAISFTAVPVSKGVPQTVNFVNTTSNATGYIWNFGDASGTVVQTNPSHVYNAAGAYTVTLIAFGTNACNDTLRQTVVIVDTVGLSMPNVFTPNGDGINDYFAPKAHGMSTLTCIIYDRWGAKMATLDNTNQQYWDGHTSAGLACTDGTYFYIVTATDVNGKNYSLKGFLELIR